VTGDDLVATVTRLLADLIVDAGRQHRLAELVFSGGGSRNPTTLGWVQDALPETRVTTSEMLGVPVQAKEALAFAVLGYLSWHGLPGSVQSATGARHPSILGSFTPGRGPLQLPVPAPQGPKRLHLAQVLCRWAVRSRPEDNPRLLRGVAQCPLRRSSD
jgi:anhydro-N-acetylmuramic acid kinase